MSGWRCAPRTEIRWMYYTHLTCCSVACFGRGPGQAQASSVTTYLGMELCGLLLPWPQLHCPRLDGTFPSIGESCLESQLWHYGSLD
jgi:hypothetical protein